MPGHLLGVVGMRGGGQHERATGVLFASKPVDPFILLRGLRFEARNLAFSDVQSPGELAAHLYAESNARLDVDGVAVKLRQTTNYPWEGTVELAYCAQRS